MGNWIFVCRHPLYAGLPVDEMMKGNCQIPVWNCYGLQMDGPGVAMVAVCGWNHDRNLGAATFIAKLGLGKLVFECMSGTVPAIRRRLLSKALIYLSKLGPNHNEPIWFLFLDTQRAAVYKQVMVVSSRRH